VPIRTGIEAALATEVIWEQASELRALKRIARRQAAEWLDPLNGHLADGGVGNISELFDGDAPQRPCRCIGHAWGVAEVLRA
jgi:glycogen debranching enzyme